MKERLKEFSEPIPPGRVDTVTPKRFFFLTVCISFAAALVVLLAASHFLDLKIRAAHPTVHGNRQLHFAGISDGLIQNGVPRELTKRYHEWWINRVYSSTQDGAGLKLLEDEKLFSEAFPGYPADMRLDNPLWNRYFKRNFDSNNWLPTLIDSREYYIHTSWLGCTDIFESYGADTVVFGNSESFIGLIPQVLSQSIAGGKVLFCTRFAMTPESITQTAAIFRKMITNHGFEKIPRIIVGYAQNWAVDSTYDPSPDSIGQEKTLKEFLNWQSPFWRFMGLKGKDLVTPPRWADIEPVELKDLRTPDLKIQPVASAAKAGLPQENFAFGFAVRKSDLPNIEAVAKIAEAYYAPEFGTYGGNCKHSELPTQALAKMKSALMEVAKEVFVFRTPVSPFHYRIANPCVHKLVDSLLLAAKDDRFHVRLDRTADYGLGWKDFAKPAEDPDSVWLDFNHVNYAGAKTLSTAIGHWLTERS